MYGASDEERKGGVAMGAVRIYNSLQSTFASIFLLKQIAFISTIHNGGCSFHHEKYGCGVFRGLCDG